MAEQDNAYSAVENAANKKITTYTLDEWKELTTLQQRAHITNETFAIADSKETSAASKKIVEADADTAGSIEPGGYGSNNGITTTFTTIEITPAAQIEGIDLTVVEPIEPAETVIVTANDEAKKIANGEILAEPAPAVDGNVATDNRFPGQTSTVETTAFVEEKVVKDSKPAVSTFPGITAYAVNTRDVPTFGVPDISPNARSGENIKGTTIHRRNKSLIHSCDFANDLKKTIYLKKFLKSIARWVREGIRKLMQFLGFSDASGSFSSIINALKKLAKELKYIKTEYIDPIIEFEKYVLAVLVKIRAIIQWILSLPAKLLALLAACLLKLLKSLVQMFVDAWKEAGAELGQSADAGKSFEELSGAIKDAATAAGELLTATSTAAGLAVGIAVSATVGLVAPVTESEVTAANKTITNYSGSVPAGLEVPSDPDFLKLSIP